MCREKSVDTEVVKAIGSTLFALQLRQSVYREDLKRAGESQTERIRAEREKVSRQKGEDLKAALGSDFVTVFDRDSGISRMTSGAIR